MKFTDIAKLAKSRKVAIIRLDENKEQWVDIGGAIYKLEGVPKMDGETFLRLAGVAENKIGGYYAKEDEDSSGLLKNDKYGEIELTSDMAGISLECDGRVLMPFYTLRGVVWLDVGLMAPIIKSGTEYIRFFLREISDGYAIAVKDGLNMIALIGEVKMSEYLMNQIATLYGQCRTRGVCKTEDEKGAEADMKYATCEHCGAHLDHGEKCDCENEE